MAVVRQVVEEEEEEEERERRGGCCVRLLNAQNRKKLGDGAAAIFVMG
jgi:hypothetical protein